MKRIYITVDVECHDINKVNSYIWGVTKKGEYGVRYIASQAVSHNIPINFFVDMCESNRYGDEYTEQVINTIQERGQPIYLHVHPNYITGDDERTFLWQYGYDEQKDILGQAFDQYRMVMKTTECKAFRAGRYAASEQMYDVLNDLGEKVIDLSYGYKNQKMCHLLYEHVKTINRPILYKNQVVFPNTRFVCFDFFGKVKTLNLDIQEARFSEIKTVLKKEKAEDIVFTMHSWHFINRYFYKDAICGNQRAIRKFNRLIKFCKKNGYKFCNLGEEDLRSRVYKEQLEREIINTSKGILNKIKSLFCNFFRFQEIAKVNKKYFKKYRVFYALLGAVSFSCLCLLLWVLL